MRYSIWFEKITTGEKINSYDDFYLFPKNRNKIIVGGIDDVTDNQIEIEGRDGTYDWYHIIGYETPFKKASDTYDFYCNYDPVKVSWTAYYTRLMKFFNGELMNIWLDEVPDEPVVGRVYISSWASPASGLSEVSLSYTLTKEQYYV